MGNFIRSSVVDPERASARAILAKMLTNNLAKEINLEGGNKKIAFRSLHLYQVFQGNVKQYSNPGSYMLSVSFVNFLLVFQELSRLLFPRVICMLLKMLYRNG